MTPPRRRHDAATSTDVHPTPVRASRWRRALRQLAVLAVVSVGGGLGSLARYVVAVQLPTRPDAFPWGTFLANVTGCLLIGVLMVVVTEVRRPGRYLRPFLGVGVLGGFTTFSTFTAETRALADNGAWLLANLYVVDSVLAGLAAAWVGVAVTRRLARRRNGDNR